MEVPENGNQKLSWLSEYDLGNMIIAQLYMSLSLLEIVHVDVRVWCLSDLTLIDGRYPCPKSLPLPIQSSQPAGLIRSYSINKLHKTIQGTLRLRPTAKATPRLRILDRRSSTLAEQHWTMTGRTGHRNSPWRLVVAGDIPNIPSMILDCYSSCG